jgi:hypothetical protein
MAMRRSHSANPRAFAATGGVHAWLRVPRMAVRVVTGCRFGHIVKCARIWRAGEFGAATPTAFHSRLRWAATLAFPVSALFVPVVHLGRHRSF